VRAARRVTAPGLRVIPDLAGVQNRCHAGIGTLAYTARVSLASQSEARLIRGIGPWALTAFALNLTIGSGILGLPARLQALVGNYSIAVIVVCGLLIALIALCFAEIGSRFDRTGGPQLYASIAFGPGVGFAVGWLLWISRIGTCAAVSNLLIDYGKVLVPQLAQPVVCAGTISMLVLAYTWINIRGIRQTAAVSTAFAVSKLVPLVAFAIVGMFFIEPQRIQFGALPPLRDASNAVLLASFAYFGFDGTTVLAGEVRDPPRSIPFAIVLSVCTVMLLYSFIQMVCVGTLPNLAASERPLADAATVLVGPWASVALAVTAVMSCAGVFGASMTLGTRLLFAMADQRQLPGALARIHARFHTPTLAILVTAAAAWVLAVSGSFIYLVKVTLIARVSVYAITCLTLPVFRHRADLAVAAFKVPAGPIVAYLCAILCVLSLANSSMRELLDVSLAVLLGLTIFGLTRLLRRVPVARIT
jgi:basic amino acid/polyamine antiporter, APA family